MLISPIPIDTRIEESTRRPEDPSRSNHHRTRRDHHLQHTLGDVGRLSTIKRTHCSRQDPSLSAAGFCDEGGFLVEQRKAKNVIDGSRQFSRFSCTKIPIAILMYSAYISFARAGWLWPSCLLRIAASAKWDRIEHRAIDTRLSKRDECFADQS